MLEDVSARDTSVELGSVTVGAVVSVIFLITKLISTDLTNSGLNSRKFKKKSKELRSNLSNHPEAPSSSCRRITPITVLVLVIGAERISAC